MKNGLKQCSSVVKIAPKNLSVRLDLLWSVCMAPLDRSGLLAQAYGEPDSRVYSSSVILPWSRAKVTPRREKGRTIGAPRNSQPSQLYSEVAVQAGRRRVLIDESLVDESSFLKQL